MLTAAAESGTSRELGINHETLRNWVGALRRERGAPGGPVSGDERAELARLRRRVAELELEKEIRRRPPSSASSEGDSVGASVGRGKPDFPS